jgi:hypothetical protein
MTQRARSHALAASALAASATALAAVDAADATTVDEAFDFSDFGGDFASSSLLPAGADVVNGTLFAFEGDNDFISFQSLTAGASFTISSTNDGDASNVFNITEYDGSGTPLQSAFGPSASLSGTIPGNGQLHFGMFVEGGGTVDYSLLLTVPEPTGAALLGGGLLAAAALRRVRRGA